MMKRLRDTFEIVVLLAVLLASAVIVRQLWHVRTRPSDSTASVAVPTRLISIAGAPQKGSPYARVVMIIYSDFQCPFCASFARDTLPQIERDYIVPGTLAIAFRNLPIQRIHPHAMAAAEAGLCANRQARFWSWHDALFRSDGAPTVNALYHVADLTGLDMTKFASCMEGGDVSTQVKDELREASSLGIRGTPAFLLGSKQAGGAVEATLAISGARPYADFRDAIDSITSHNASR